MKEIIIWKLYLPTKSYIRVQAIPSLNSDEMISLENFLESDVRDNSSGMIQHLTDCQNNDVCTGFTMNITEITKLENKQIALTFVYGSDSKSLVISLKNLIYILQQWGAAYKEYPPYIILERDNDTYSVRGAHSIENIE